MNEHKVILRIADVLIAIAQESERRSQLNKEDVFGILEILRQFGDEYHQGKEERALFPVFTAVCERDEVDAIRHMIHEHDEDRSLLESMEEALHQSNAADFAIHARRLDEILRMHIFKEDNILFEIVNSSLSDTDDQRILAGFEVFDKTFKTPRHDRLMHRLQMLEQKYLPVGAAT